MDKINLMHLIQDGLKDNIISENDIVNVLKLSNLSRENVLEQPFKVDNHKSSLDFGKIFSLIGGLVIFLGLGSVISQYWDEMNSIWRVVSTLGTGLSLFTLGSSFLLYTKQRFTGLAIHLIPPFLIAFGANVLYFQVIMGGITSDWTDLMVNSIIYSLIFGLYVAADSLTPSKLFSFVAWISGTVAYWYVVLFLIEVLKISNYLLYDNRMFTLFGLIYSCVVFCFLYFNDKNTQKKAFNNIVLFCTTSYFLINIFWFLSDKLILEALFSLVLFYTIFVSIKINKFSVLLSSIIGVILYISYLSSRYFSNTLGWPIALIIIGLGFVGCGYLFVNLKKRINKPLT